MSLTHEDIDAVCGLVIDLCGVYLDESKSYLIESRLGDLVNQSGCDSYVDLVRRVRYSAQNELRTQIIDAITTNETLFFRDATLFDALERQILPELIREKAATRPSNRIRIWSAGCSTGQEPYSLAMLLSELLPDVHAWDINIVGSDVSDDAVSRASRGLFSSQEIERGLTPQRQARFVQKENAGWRVKDSLRGLVTFERKNLLGPFATAGKFDLVLCRNVAIYFTPEVRRDLFQRITNTLTPSGTLIVGSQESLADLGPRFAPQKAGRAVVYRPNLQLV